MRLFVYGIFLGEGMRRSYGMTVVGYDTVLNYITVGDHIVQARKVDPDMGAALTGLVVDVPERLEVASYPGIERDNIKRLDSLEGGYDRVEVKTTGGEVCQMYIERNWDDRRTETVSGQGSRTA